MKDHTTGTSQIRSLITVLSAAMMAAAIILLADHVARHVLPIEDPPVPKALCRHTVGRVYVADEQGRVCRWQDMNYESGCCPRERGEATSQGAGEELSKFMCDEENCPQGCCLLYPFCVSCCIQNTDDPSIPDKFDNCQFACRTSSKSVTSDNQFVSSHRYCYNRTSHAAPTTTGLIITPEKSEAKAVPVEPVLERFPIKKTSGVPDDSKLLDQLATNQRKQDEILERLEQQVKELSQRNDKLLEENKKLATQLKPPNPTPEKHPATNSDSHVENAKADKSKPEKSKTLNPEKQPTNPEKDKKPETKIHQHEQAKLINDEPKQIIADARLDDPQLRILPIHLSPILGASGSCSRFPFGFRAFIRAVVLITFSIFWRLL